MALIPCPECGRELSAEADACPACGKPNVAARNKAKDSKQKAGCAVMIAALLLALVVPPIVAVVVFIVGLLLTLLNTRYK